MAVSCDLLDSELPGKHYKCDVLNILNLDWDLIIAHPPCTYLCNSGVRWLHERDGRFDLMNRSAEFFKKFLNCNAKHIAVENPIMHKYAINRIGRKQDFTIQPYEFGERESKRTCFWVKNLPDLLPTKILTKYKQSVHKCKPGKNRWKSRSRTFPGIAEAIASQWGHFIINNSKKHN